MTINKQKFLAELGRLLTFMYEEDRQRALALYHQIFDEAEDEQGVLQILVSPTRQAVNLARAYDAKERKLQVQAQSRAEDSLAREEEALPAFVQVIDKIRDEAAALGIAAPKSDDDQFSLFSDDVDDALFREDAPADAVAAPPAEAAAVVAAAPAEDEGPLDGEAPLFEDDLPGESEDAEAQPEAPGDAEAMAEAPEDAEVQPEASEDAEAQPEASEDAEAQPEATEDAGAQPPQDEVDAFLSDFSIENDELPEAQPETAAEPVKDAADAPFDELPPLEAAPAAADMSEAPAQAAPPVKTRRKARGFLLLLFVLIAIPVTLLCIALLLIPTLIAFLIGAGALYGGAMSFASGLANFSVFADILLVIGAALIVIALGLLFAWIFIWLLGGVIPGLIRGVFRLGRKLCYKEVPAV